MIILAVQSVIVPVLLSFLVQTSHQRFTFLRGKLTLLFILLWLFVYAWIIKLPHIPPKQALDWIGIFSLLTVLPFLKLAVHHQWVKSYLLIVGCLFFITSTWPVISYDASFSSHKLIWAEISALYIWFAVVLVREINVNGATYSYFNLAFSVLSLAAITIMSGSLLLGLLVLAYGMILVVPAMSEILPFKLFEFSDRYTILHWPIVFYLALICRVYGDISLLALSLLLGALTLNFLYKGKYRSFTLGISSVLNICALCFIIWQEYLSNAANMSHY